MDLSVRSQKWFGEGLNIWCNVSRKLKRGVNVALHVVCSAKQTSQQVSDYRNCTVWEERFLKSFLLLKLSTIPICLKLCIESSTEALKEVLCLYIRNKMLKESHVIIVNIFHDCYHEMITFYTHFHYEKMFIAYWSSEVHTDVSSSVLPALWAEQCGYILLLWKHVFLDTLLYIC